jgi:hypothetical protein
MPLPLGTSHLSSPVAVPNIVILKMSKFYSVRMSNIYIEHVLHRINQDFAYSYSNNERISEIIMNSSSN